MRLLSLLAILLLLITSSTNSSAQPAPQPKKIRLAKGKPAPFAGNLLSDAAIAKITSEYERRIKQLRLDLEKVRRERDLERKTYKAIHAAKLEAEKAKRKACVDDKDRQRKLFFQTLDSKKCPHPAWNYLSFIGGAVIGGGICALAEGVKQ